MLGRLRMSIDEAIKFYYTLAQKVFSKQKRDGRLQASPLEKMLKELVKARTGHPEALMLDRDMPTCKM